MQISRRNLACVAKVSASKKTQAALAIQVGYALDVLHANGLPRKCCTNLLVDFIKQVFIKLDLRYITESGDKKGIHTADKVKKHGDVGSTISRLKRYARRVCRNITLPTISPQDRALQMTQFVPVCLWSENGRNCCSCRSGKGHRRDSLGPVEAKLVLFFNFFILFMFYVYLQPYGL